MNDQERSEFEALKRQHARLEQDLAVLSKQLNLLGARLDQPVIEPPKAPIVSERTLPEKPPEISRPAPVVPPPIPPIISQKPVQEAKPVAFMAQPLARPASPPTQPPPFVPVVEPVKERSFEMRLGRHWAPRIGIVMVLTAFVFFANYAYQNFIVKIGPAGKVSLLYLASGILLAAGAWWQRKAAKESLKNYAQVLFAGGLAAVYFTTYAAHHLVNLRVIGDPLLDGALLLAWAGFMVWNADRRKSEILALFAVGLAYYTSIITRVGSFTLYSNLVLTLAAVFFLVRNRWAGLSFASLIATYVSYGFWRFFDGDNWHWASPEQGLWHGTYFLVAYWVVFTAAVFISKNEKLSGSNRAAFLTLNNLQFFVMFLLTLLQVRHEGYWQFFLSYGAALLVLAEVARWVLPAEPLAKNSYLTQGLLLVTVGLISKYSGLQLALLLAAESVVLMTLGTARKNSILQTGAYLSGALAVGWGIDGLEHYDRRKLCYNVAVGAMMAFNAFWSRRGVVENKETVRPVPAFFTILALVSWFATTWYNTSSANFPLALAIEALVLTFSIYLLRVREIGLFAQSYLIAAHCAWLFHFINRENVPPWWNPALLIAITLGLSHWWQRQKVMAAGTSLSLWWQGVYALVIIGVLNFWLAPLVSPANWLVLTSVLAIGITAYGVFTRLWPLAMCAQILLFLSAWQFTLQLLDRKPDWYFPLAPVAGLAFLSFATVTWFRRRPDAAEKIREPLLQLALLYRWTALILSLWWIREYIPAAERVWVLMFLGLLTFLWAGWRKNSEALLFSAAFSVYGLKLFWLPPDGAPTVYWPNLLAILVLPGAQRIALRYPDRFALTRRVQAAMISLGGLSLWLFLTCWVCGESGFYRWVFHQRSGAYLTASWSALALVLFTCGMILRERVYRWLGLAILACALGRVFLFDVWKLETLYRILSFMALGIALLVLGFFYNKYQEKIKEWL